MTEEERWVRAALPNLMTAAEGDLWLHALQDRFDGRSALQCFADGDGAAVAAVVNQMFAVLPLGQFAQKPARPASWVI